MCALASGPERSWRWQGRAPRVGLPRPGSMGQGRGRPGRGRGQRRGRPTAVGAAAVAGGGAAVAGGYRPRRGHDSQWPVAIVTATKHCDPAWWQWPTRM